MRDRLIACEERLARTEDRLGRLEERLGRLQEGWVDFLEGLDDRIKAAIVASREAEANADRSVMGFQNNDT